VQFHLNGFRPGDPGIIARCTPRNESAGARPLPHEADVLIVGCGPAGLTLAAQLSAFPAIRTVIVDQKTGPLQLGQADGIACRTMEMFEAFGFVDRVLKEAYWVNETAFWKPLGEGADIVRSGRVQDTEDGLSEFPHVILNQARVHDFYLETMRNGSARLEPDYGWRLTGFEVSGDPAEAFPVTARLERVETDGVVTAATVKVRYLVGCDGARSVVRKSMDLDLHGDGANQAWGVMDVLALTDFPDIRLKSLIQSASDGSMLIIPREGGYLVRFYIELDKLAKDQRVASLNTTSDHLVAAARRILAPYTLDVKEIAWWSVYEIGQRLCDRFDDAAAHGNGARVFIAGDACHTHSPKAGQGMNVSMQDAFNLGWKLAAVLRGQSGPALLETYSRERHAIAAELIDFDREWASMLSRSGTESRADPSRTQRYFVRHGRYTAGTASRYERSGICGPSTHQRLAAGLPIGMRFHSAPAVRLSDAKPVQLGHVVKADGRWRIFAFAGAREPMSPQSDLSRLCDFLMTSDHSPVLRHTPTGADIDSVIDVRAIFQQTHCELSPMQAHKLLVPAKGRYGLRDYEKLFCADARSGDVFDLRGIDRARGCMVVVRPDQYVAHVLPLAAHEELAAFFQGFMIDQNRAALPQASRPHAAMAGQRA